jgi:hypothetical protein
MRYDRGWTERFAQRHANTLKALGYKAVYTRHRLDLLHLTSGNRVTLNDAFEATRFLVTQDIHAEEVTLPQQPQFTAAAPAVAFTDPAFEYGED